MGEDGGGGGPSVTGNLETGAAKDWKDPVSPETEPQKVTGVPATSKDRQLRVKVMVRPCVGSRWGS